MNQAERAPKTRSWSLIFNPHAARPTSEHYAPCILLNWPSITGLTTQKLKVGDYDGSSIMTKKAPSKSGRLGYSVLSTQP